MLGGYTVYAVHWLWYEIQRAHSADKHSNHPHIQYYLNAAKATTATANYQRDHMTKLRHSLRRVTRKHAPVICARRTALLLLCQLCEWGEYYIIISPMIEPRVRV